MRAVAAELSSMGVQPSNDGSELVDPSRLDLASEPSPEAKRDIIHGLYHDDEINS
jgi:hypothetical protein